MGAFVDGYVTGVTLRGLDIARAGSTGVYLEAGSTDNVVGDSTISFNGYEEVKPEGQPFIVKGSSSAPEHRPGRDRRRRIPEQHHPAQRRALGTVVRRRRQPHREQRDRHRPHRDLGRLADGGEHLPDGQQRPDPDPTYVTNRSVALDDAANNVIRANALGYLSYGIRVEDDGTRVEGNTFGSGVGPALAVLVGTKYRTTELDRPVEGTVLTANTANGAPSVLVEGTQPPINPFIFAIRIWTP